MIDKPLTPKQRVLQTINDSDKPISPIEVYQEIKVFVDIKKSTVRTYIARLLKRRKIRKLYTGLYVSHRLYGVLQGDLRTENMRFNLDAMFLGSFPKISDVIEYQGTVKIRIQFGVEHKKISCTISQREDLRKWERGFTKNTLILAVNRSLSIMEERTKDIRSRPLDSSIELTSWEMNKDYGGKRLDGKLGCFTKQEFFETITKVYLKDNQTVRAERKISTKLSVNDAMQMLTGDPLDSNLKSGLLTINQNITQFKVAQKYMNHRLGDVERGLYDLQTRKELREEDRMRMALLENNVSDLMEMSRSNQKALVAISDFLIDKSKIRPLTKNNGDNEPESIVTSENPFVC